MTKIRVDWQAMTLDAEGHSGGGMRGNNIICAGISALTQALLNQLIRDRRSEGNPADQDGPAGGSEDANPELLQGDHDRTEGMGTIVPGKREDRGGQRGWH